MADSNSGKELENLSLSHKKVDNFSDISNRIEQTICLCGFVDGIRKHGKTIFVVLRDRLETVQLICFSKNCNYEDISEIVLEEYVKIVGVVKNVPSPILSCSVKDFEIHVSNINVLGHVYDVLPFNPKDISSSNVQKRANVSTSLRLDNRFLDLRIPCNYALFKIIGRVTTAFRRFFHENDFMEIRTPKIIQGGSEGGANLFQIDYFGKKAFLAQSAQLYKQMAVIGGMQRVFEIGPCYRAEESNFSRYLSEFWVVDAEMVIDEDYSSVIDMIYAMLVSVIKEVNDNCQKELEIVRKQNGFKDIVYSEKPVIISHSEGIDMLNKLGFELSYEDDFNREQEKVLGNIIKEKNGVDLFVVKDYPVSQRAFYTYVDSETGKTRSYDFIMRGVEILSGAQRETVPEKLDAAIRQKEIPVDSLNFYLNAFKYGAPPHAGCGIGFERFIMTLLDFDDIRMVSLFPRDPHRLNP